MSEALTVKEITTLRGLRAFINMPIALYRGNPNWVPSLFIDDYHCLRKDKNPAFEHCEARYWLAYRDQKAVGRIAAIYNRKHVEQWNEHYLRFGWVDFIDDPAVSRALFAKVELWAKEKRLTAIHGPLGFTDLDREGMLIEGFNELSTMATSYNFPYYPEHMHQLGFTKDADWVEYEITMSPYPNQAIARIADLSIRRNKLKLIIEKNRKKLLGYAYEMFKLINDEYAHLFGFVSLTDKQIERYIKQYFGFILPEYVPLVLDQNDRVVAFGITMPSLSLALQQSSGKLFPFGFMRLLRALKKADRADLCLVAVRSEYQGKGVNAILMDSIHRTYAQKGIQKIETNPELESNQDVQGQWKYYQTRQHKRRRCFIKHLDSLHVESPNETGNS